MLAELFGHASRVCSRRLTRIRNIGRVRRGFAFIPNRCSARSRTFFNSLSSGTSTDARLDDVRQYLYQIIEEDESDYADDICMAAISLADLGDNSEYVRDILLNLLKNFAANLKHMGIDSVDPDTPGVIEIVRSRVAMGANMARALATFKNDKEVVGGLSKIIQSTPVTRYSPRDEFMPVHIIDACLRTIGAIGDESGKELLEYWGGKQNMAAKAALELFGESWDDIRGREGEIEKETKEAEEAKRIEAARIRESMSFVAKLWNSCYLLWRKWIYH